MPRSTETEQFLNDIESAITTFETDSPPQEASRELIKDLFRIPIAPEDTALYYLTLETDVLLNQIVRYGTPDLNDRTISVCLKSFKTHYENSLNDPSELYPFETWVNNLRDDVNETRPNTDIIGEHNLEAAFDESVQRIIDDHEN